MTALKTDRVEALKEFIEKFEASKDPDLWAKLCEEESNELVEAFAATLKEAADLAYVLTGLYVVLDNSAVRTDEYIRKLKKVDTIIGLIEDVFSGLPSRLFDETFTAVHESNMSKLDDDGKPVRREDGKILKGPNYKAPDIEALVLEYFGQKS